MSATTPQQEVAEPTRARTLLFQSRRRGGPLPAPADLEHYERICPGAADRILKVMEREQSHRQELTAKIVEMEVINAGRSLPIGGAIALLAVCGATLVGLFGSWEAAVALVGIPLAAIVRAFVAPKGGDHGTSGHE
jgi:uncharacterized membrane protein